MTNKLKGEKGVVGEIQGGKFKEMARDLLHFGF